MVRSFIKPSAIIEAAWPLPDGTYKRHPALIISLRAVSDNDNVFVAVMMSSKTRKTPTTFEITPDMVSQPSQKHLIVYAKCHLVGSFDATAAYRHFGYMHPEPFGQLLAHFKKTVIGL